MAQATPVFGNFKRRNKSGSGLRLLARWLASVSFLAIVLPATQMALGVENADLVAKSQLAMQAMSAGKFEEAATLYADLVRASPNNPGLRMDWGLALHSAGHFREALQQFQKVIKQEPRNGPALMMLGVAYLKLSDPQLAIEPLRRSVEIESKNTVARFELADTLMETGRPAEAADQFRFLTQIDPDNAKAWQGLGLSYAALSRRAFADLEKIAPSSAYFVVLSARSFTSQNELHTAFNLYKKALTASPSLLSVHAGLANIYEKTGHQEWAEVEQNRERQMPHPDCLTQSVECEFLEGHYLQLVRSLRGQNTPQSDYWRSRSYQELSLEAFTHLSQMPASPAIHELLAEAYRIQGQYDLALNEWQEALKLTPQDRRLTMGLAQTLWLNREYQKARPLLEKLVKDQPQSQELNFQLGDTLLRLGDSRGAIPYLEKAVKISPKNKIAHDSLGLAYTRVNQTEKAIPQFRAALGLDDEGTVEYHLAQAYKQIGRNVLAQEYLVKFERASRAMHARQPQNIEDFQITPP